MISFIYLKCFFSLSFLKKLEIWEAWWGILLWGEQHSQILDLIPLAAAQTATDRHIISWGVLAPQPTSKHRTEPLLCIAAFQNKYPDGKYSGRKEVFMCIWLFVQSKIQKERGTLAFLATLLLVLLDPLSPSSSLCPSPLLLFLSSSTVPCVFWYSYRCLDLTGSFSWDCAQAADSSHLHFASQEKREQKAVESVSRQTGCVNV